jgi:hypothetical protein
MGAWDEGEYRIFMHDREQSSAMTGHDECRLRDGAWSGVTWRVVCGVSCGRWRGNGSACCIFRRKQSGLCARVCVFVGVCHPVRRSHYRLLYLFAAVLYARIFTSSPYIPDSSFCPSLPALGCLPHFHAVPRSLALLHTPHLFRGSLPLSSLLSSSPPRPPLAVQ